MKHPTLHIHAHDAGSPTTGQRLDEVAGLLAAGLLRLRLRDAASGGEPEKREQKQLDAGARQSVHASRTRV